jgi:hypothetical protein
MKLWIPTVTKWTVVPSDLKHTIYAAVLVLAVPYLAGFFYLSTYFQYFEINMAELELTDPEIYSAAFVVLFKAVRALLGTLGTTERTVVAILMCILACSLWVWFAGEFRGKIRQRLATIKVGAPSAVLPMLAGASFLSVPILGAYIGAASAREDVGSLPFISLIKSEGLPNPLRSIDDTTRSEILRYPFDQLIFSNERDYFVLRSENETSAPVTIRVKRSDVYLSVVWRRER